MKKQKGFTLIELLIVIVILSVLAFLITPNLLTSLKKGRDARRKGDLSNIQKALEMYYEDNRAYPTTLDLTTGSKLCKTPPNCTGEKIYMIKLPTDPSTGYKYSYCGSANNQGYQIYASLENTLDSQIITASCQTANCGTGHVCNFGLSSPNSTP